MRESPVVTARTLAALGALLLAAGCSDRQVGEPRLPAAVFNVSDGAHDPSGGTAGNPDFFFLTPLVPNPSGDADFEAGQFNAFVRPTVVIRHLLVESNPSCAAQGTVIRTFHQEISVDVTGERYQVGWQTGDDHLIAGNQYRICVLFGATELGFRDIQPDENGADVPRNPEQLPILQFNNGSNLPIKFRIENGALCTPPGSKTCATKTVDLAGGATDLVLGDRRLDIPPQGGQGEINLTFQPCTVDDVDALIDLPTFGPCLQTVTEFTGRLTIPAIISICQDLHEVVNAADLTDPAQRNLITLYHFHGNGETVDALPHASACSGIASAPSSPWGRFARALGDGVRSLVGVRPLSAANVLLDRGGGGETDGFDSKFKLVLPGKIALVNPADTFRVAPVGSALPSNVRVTDLQDRPIKGARVRFNVIESPGGGGSVSPAVVFPTDATGTAVGTWTLDVVPGLNRLTAGGRGIADPLNNGPRNGFDPFQSIWFYENSTDAIVTQVDEQATPVLEPTQVTFRAIGCQPGFGTPTAINGVMGPGEWTCALTFPFTANLSGGSTPATLFVMNDGANLYLAVRVARQAADKPNTLRFDLDRDGDGVAELKDDVLEHDVVLGTKRDRYLTDKCTNSTQSACGADDTAAGGANNILAGFTNDGTFSYYEVSHPLNSGDGHDIAVQTGNQFGLFLTLSLGRGAQGNTQWPGFRVYLPITVK